MSIIDYEVPKSVFKKLHEIGIEGATRYIPDRRRGDYDFPSLHFLDESGRYIHVCSQHNMSKLKKHSKNLIVDSKIFWEDKQITFTV